MATSGGIEFNDDNIDPELDLNNQGDLEGSFDELPPEATDFDVTQFEEQEIGKPEEDVTVIPQDVIDKITDEVTEKVLNVIADNNDDIEIDNIVEAPKDSPVVKNIEDLPKGKDLEKAINKEFSKLRKEANQEASRTKRELAKQQRREIQDEKRALRREKRDVVTSATRRRTDINSDATSAKIATYSLAAAVGLPGYVIASITNRLLIEPIVEKDLEAERTYSDQVVDYFNNQDDAILEKQRAYEDERDAIEPADIALDDVRDFMTSKVQRPSTKPINKQIDFKDVTKTVENTTSFKDTNTQTNNPVQFSTPSQTTNTPANKPNSPSGVTGVPTAGGANVPPIIPPPNIGTNPAPQGGLPATPTRGFNPSSLVAGAGIIAGAVEAAQFVTKQVKSAGEATQGTIKDLYNESPINYYANNTQRATDLLDPLGVNVPMQAFNQSIQSFATAVEEFGKYTDKDIGFSPETLSVSVQGDIDKLVKNMEIAQRIDPQKAALKESMNQLDLIWSEFKAEFFVVFAPFISRTLEVIVVILTAVKDVISAIHTVATGIYTALSLLPGIGYLLNSLVKNTAREQKDNVDSLANELARFHDPANQPFDPATVLNRR